MKKGEAILMSICFLLSIFSVLSFYEVQEDDFSPCDRGLVAGWNTDIYDTNAGIFYEQIKQSVMEDCING